MPVDVVKGRVRNVLLSDVLMFLDCNLGHVFKHQIQFDNISIFHITQL